MTTYIINKDYPGCTVVTYDTAPDVIVDVTNRAAVVRAIGDGHIDRAGTYIACTPDGDLLLATEVEVSSESKLVIV